MFHTYMYHCMYNMYVFRQQPAPQSLTAPGTLAPATARLADGQMWSDLASAVDTDPRADGFQIPRYHRKKAAAVKAAPPKAIEQTKKRRQVDVYYGKKKSDAFKSAPENWNCSFSTSRRRRT